MEVEIVLSFVIPVYNAERYLHRCLSSILQEEHDAIEVLLIDDASTDGSLDLLKDYLVADNRTRLFTNSENSLVGRCRNIGIKNAKGKFIWFVDADDWLSPLAVSHIINILSESEDFQILSFGFAEHYGDHGLINYRIPARTSLDHVPMINFLKIRTGFSSMPFSYIFRKSFLEENDLYFPEGVYFEDIFFMGKVFYLLSEVRVYERVFYNYNRSNRNSITLHPSGKKIQDLIGSYQRLQKLLAEEAVPKRFINLLAFRFLLYGLPRIFRMYLSLPPEERQDVSLRAVLSKFRNSRLMRLKSIGRAVLLARDLSEGDPLQRVVFRRNIRLLLQVKYALWLILLVRALRAFPAVDKFRSTVHTACF